MSSLCYVSIMINRRGFLFSCFGCFGRPGRRLDSRCPDYDSQRAFAHLCSGEGDRGRRHLRYRGGLWHSRYRRQEQILSLKSSLIGKDPREIDTIVTFLGEHTPDLSGTRTDGSAHELMRAASGIEMALWDLAGKALGVPCSTLLGGRFRRTRAGVRSCGSAQPAG